jgi:integrase
MREMNRLDARKVASKQKPGRYGDGGGLWLQVSQLDESKPVTKSWLFRYMINGRARQMGLGPVHTFSLKEARELAREARQQVAAGIDPINARDAEAKAALAKAAAAKTFQECAEQYIKDHRASWKNPKHAAQWPSTLETYVYPKIGKLNVADVDLPHILNILEPIWKDKPETASRVRGRIETVLGWATTRKYREGDNPARWRGHLQTVLPAKSKIHEKQHHPALPYAEIPEFMAELRERKGISAAALEFTILTSSRTQETIGACWDEINFATKLWTIPGGRKGRMKAGKEHIVPLSDRAIELLTKLPREKDSPFIFPGSKTGEPLSNMAMLELLRGMRPELTVHGFRSTFRDWAGEQTAFDRETIEFALAHGISDQAEASYRRGRSVEKRRHLMQAWATYCGTKPKALGDNVTAIRGTA